MAYSRGDRLNQYEILGTLGRGGMGEVYHARDTVLGREVAIKVSFSQFSARFKREAAAIASLNHPNICTLFEAGPDYLVMELVEGPTLAERIKAGPIPLEEALEIARQIAAALEAAHDKPVIHRDLKPANIKIRPDGLIKVLDFGLAKSRERDTDSEATVTMGMSEAGMIVGTPAYMSPEQARGLDVDRRSDIWAYGVVLYEMVTGKRLYEGPTSTDILAAVVTKQVDFADAPSKVRKLLRICVEKDAKKRLRDIGEAWRHLETEEAPAPVQVAAPPPKPGWLWPAVAGVSFVAAAGALGWTLTRPEPVPQLTQFEIHAPEGSKLPLGTPAVSPDGRTLVYTVTGPDGVTKLHVRTLDRLETRELPGTDGAGHPFFSPDGKSVAFASQNKMQRIDLSGGSPLFLMDIGGPWHGSWGGASILGTAQATLHRVPAAGGTAERAHKSDEETNFPFFLRDGVRYLTRVPREASSSIQLAKLGSEDREMVLDNVFSAPLAAPSPEGDYLLYLRDTALMAQRFDEATGKVLADPAVLVDNVGRVANPAFMPTVGVSLTSGTLAFQRGESGEYVHQTLLDRAGKSLGNLTDSNFTGLSVSPDGNSVAYVNVENTGRTSIWITDVTRKVTSRLTFGASGAGGQNSPVWSPDSKRIFFRKQGQGIFEKDASGAGEEREVLKGGLTPWSITPDGQTLLVRDGQRLALISLGADKKLVPVGSPLRNGGGDISPDGKFVAYESDESGHRQVYVQPMPPATGRWQVSQTDGSNPQWNSNGKELFFRSEGRLMAVDATLGATFSVGIPHELFQENSGLYSPMPGGQKFLVRTLGGTEGSAPIVVMQNWWLALKK